MNASLQKPTVHDPAIPRGGVHPGELKQGGADLKHFWLLPPRVHSLLCGETEIAHFKFQPSLPLLGHLTSDSYFISQYFSSAG